MTFHYEFFGPIGTTACTLVLPVVLYTLVFASNSRGCLSLVPLQVPGWDAETTFFSWTALAVVYAWFFGQMLLHLTMPAEAKAGVVERDGQRWTYRLNAFRNFAVTYAATAYLAFATPYLPLHWAADHFLELLTAALVFACAASATLYAASFRAGAILAPSGTSGCAPYDFWMGRELNPRLLGVDLKEFCELYPGLMGWMLLNLAFAHKQWTATGQVSLAMVLINAFQLLYVADGLWFESSILTTMDITSEGFGHMLVFGDLVWVPFSYCTQAKYILEQGQDLSWHAAVAIACLNMLGYVAFRGANGQKDTFRKDPAHPSVRHLRTMPTERGTQLICSGWWGVARHVNYTGDWLMGLAWCLTCGAGCAVPYFYAAYFAALLLHRERRDDHACRAKYGRDWDRYCRLVPYRLVPYVY